MNRKQVAAVTSEAISIIVPGSHAPVEKPTGLRYVTPSIASPARLRASQRLDLSLHRGDLEQEMRT